MAVAKPDGETFHPTLILVGTRLGIDKINQVYWEALTATLQMPQSVGIAGYVSILVPAWQCSSTLRPFPVKLTVIQTQRSSIPVTLFRWRAAVGR